MSRNGLNPNRTENAKNFKPVILTVVTHLPNMDGYHEQRFEIVKTCIRSMTQHAETAHTLAVWDNGSCKEFRDWIEEEVKPDLFIQSVNVGKTAARTALFRMMPPHAIVGYSDDDIFFYPNWLQPQIKLLRHFPGVACVTGYPVRTAFRWGVENTLKWAKANGVVKAGKLMPQQWEDDFAISIGRTPDWHKKYTADDTDIMVTYKGVSAYATSHHCQFIGIAGDVGRVLQYDGRAMGDERPFDVAMDELGLRLATTERLARHIGNVMDDALRKDIMECSNILAMAG